MTAAAGGGPDTLQGNEGNDTIFGGRNIDTISGGSGNDVFVYAARCDDGNSAAGGGPVELITDVNWAEDRFRCVHDGRLCGQRRAREAAPV